MRWFVGGALREFVATSVVLEVCRLWFCVRAFSVVVCARVLVCLCVFDFASCRSCCRVVFPARAFF